MTTKTITVNREVFQASTHPLTLELIETMLPGKNVKDFSIHFVLDGGSYISANIWLTEKETEKLVEVTRDWQLAIRTPEEFELIVPDGCAVVAPGEVLDTTSLKNEQFRTFRCLVGSDSNIDISA